MREELRTEVKVKAAKRGKTIAELIEEIWQVYLTHHGAKAATEDDGVAIETHAIAAE